MRRMILEFEGPKGTVFVRAFRVEVIVPADMDAGVISYVYMREDDSPYPCTEPARQVALRLERMLLEEL